MTVATDAVFEMPDDGDNDGPRASEANEKREAHVDENNVPHPAQVNAPDDEGSRLGRDAADGEDNAFEE